MPTLRAVAVPVAVVGAQGCCAARTVDPAVLLTVQVGGMSCVMCCT
jgi:hypothetical protein